MTRRPIRAILADPQARRDLSVGCIQAIQAVAGITTTREQATEAYEKVQQEAGKRGKPAEFGVKVVTMKLRPLNDFVIVRREKPKDVSDGGIYIPEQAKLKSRTGEVLAVGPGRVLDNGTRRPIGVEPGQVIYFRGIAGQEISFDGEDLVMLREDEIEGVVER